MKAVEAKFECPRSLKKKFVINPKTNILVVLVTVFLLYAHMKIENICGFSKVHVQCVTAFLSIYRRTDFIITFF